MPRSVTASTTSPCAFGPFMPGTGCLPPYFAGRVREQAKIKKRLDFLELGMAPPSALIFFGPRGNGKTALLNWTRQRARERGIKVINFGTAEVHTEESLLSQLSPDHWWTGLLEAVSWRGAGARLRNSGASTATRALAKLAERAPTILLIDEAHTLDTTIGRQLLHGAQAVALEGLPLLLSLAGTPDLPRHLGKMQATFWERSAIAPIERLDRGASSDAIRIPLEETGKEITPEALESVVADSHGYPYFLQLWGEQLWDEARHASRPIGMEEVDRVRPQVESERKQFYSQRYRELDDRGAAPPGRRASQGVRRHRELEEQGGECSAAGHPRGRRAVGRTRGIERSTRGLARPRLYLVAPGREGGSLPQRDSKSDVICVQYRHPLVGCGWPPHGEAKLRTWIQPVTPQLGF